MVAKRKNKKMDDMSISQIIERQFNKDVVFTELIPSEQVEILKFIKNNNLGLKVCNERGYDVLKDKLFSNEFVLENENEEQLTLKRIDFDTFESYYSYLMGDIYEKACYFGYSFQNDDIEKFGIDVNKINFDAYISYDILDYSFERLTLEEKSKNDEKSREIKKISNYIKKIDGIKSYDEFIKKYDYFTKKRTFGGNGKVYFSLLIRKLKNDIKEYCIKFASTHSRFDGLWIGEILFYYGVDAAKCVLENYSGGGFSEGTIRKRKKEMLETIELFSNCKKRYRKIGKFDSLNRLFIINYFFYTNASDYPFMDISDYYLSFDEFASELGGDLSGVNLRNAPIDVLDVQKYRTNEETVFPKSSKYSNYSITKIYEDKMFSVEQKWFDIDGITIQTDFKEFDHFCDFVHYLKKDISNSDLIMCAGIENISRINGLNISGIKVRSEVAKRLNLPLNTFKIDKNNLVEFVQTQRYELETARELSMNQSIDEDSYDIISYVTDIHILHKFRVWNCETIEDANYVMNSIAGEIGQDHQSIKLIGGDISSDFNAFKVFVKKLKEYNSVSKYFFTLGNHELWPFEGVEINDIVSKYKEFLSEFGMFLVHNNLYYYDENEILEISNEELTSISAKKLREKMRSARLVIFGGLGFAGRNDLFNANQGIYRNIISREQEIKESNIFEKLYIKVANSLYDKNVIVLTHMPMKDWSNKKICRGFVYINGHNHKNFFKDDGIERIYSDNQIGYKQKEVHMKHLSINRDYDWFSDYGDGIYEISKNDYENFYRGIRERLSFNRQFKKLYMLKRNGIYMFIMVSPKGTIQILNGGAIKNASGHSLEYFYENLITYANSIKMYLSHYDKFQKEVSKEIKSIGGDGRIHGTIIDLDFYNHIYINPLDGTITPYFAYSMTEKYVYENLLSLLKYECPKMFLNYKNKVKINGLKKALGVKKTSLPITKTCHYVTSTEMYRVSRIIRGLQFTTRYNIIRFWNDVIAKEASQENGKLIVGNIINPEENDKLSKITNNSIGAKENRKMKTKNNEKRITLNDLFRE